MRDTPAHRLLLELQLELFDRLPLEFREYFSDWQSRYNSSLKWVERDIAGTYSPEDLQAFQKASQKWDSHINQVTGHPFEDRSLNALLQMIGNPIDSGAAAYCQIKGKKRPVQPVFGTLPIGRPNAFAIPVVQKNVEQSLIVFQNGMFMFLYLVAKCVAQALPLKVHKNGSITISMRPWKWKRRITQSKEIRERFSDVLLKTIFDEHQGVYGVEPYMIDRPRTHFAEMFVRLAESFVVAHEYGHLIQQHGVANAMDAKVGGVEFSACIPNWKEEFEADCIGLMLSVVMSNQEYDLAIRCFGAEFFIACADILEQAIALQENSANVLIEDTHPPAIVRRKLIRGYIKLHYGRRRARSPLKLGKRIQGVLEMLWENTKPAVIRCHRLGVPIAKNWSAL